MSRLDNIDALEKQLAELQMTMEPNTSTNKVKKIPPAVPPKKKAQPQVPRSTIVNNLCEPSYSTKITPILTPFNNSPTYGNVNAGSTNKTQKVYANTNQINSSMPHYYSDHGPHTVTSMSKKVNTSYNNIPSYGNNDDLPLPPPPPPPLPPSLSDYNYNINSDEYLPPPSPVSSNYSELARATANISFNQDRSNICPPPIYQNEYNEYGAPEVSHYESLYEPISPRSSQNYTPTNLAENYGNKSPNYAAKSTSENYRDKSPSYILPKTTETYRNNSPSYAPTTAAENYRKISPSYALASTIENYQSKSPNYAPTNTSENYCNKSPNLVPANNSENYPNKPLSLNTSNYHKEDEVDVLTNLLVQSISDSQDLDVFGTCIKCKSKVVGESSGCTAMGNVYHVNCFCCHRCKVNLQGKPFYAVEGEPYCEIDYYETLEKCSVCGKPILDRIIRATGKPYHPTCFMCVVCGKSLDGIPFTVDALNQIHCIEDFHKKFAPRCCVCELPIMPEEGEEETVRVVALDRSFHIRCYRCEDCGLLLSSQADGRGCYPLDGHILCQDCNAHRIRLLTNVMTTDL